MGAVTAPGPPPAEPVKGLVSPVLCPALRHPQTPGSAVTAPALRGDGQGRGGSGREAWTGWEGGDARDPVTPTWGTINGCCPSKVWTLLRSHQALAFLQARSGVRLPGFQVCRKLPDASGSKVEGVPPCRPTAGAEAVRGGRGPQFRVVVRGPHPKPWRRDESKKGPTRGKVRLGDKEERGSPLAGGRVCICPPDPVSFAQCPGGQWCPQVVETQEGPPTKAGCSFAEMPRPESHLTSLQIQSRRLSHHLSDDLGEKYKVRVAVFIYLLFNSMFRVGPRGLFLTLRSLSFDVFCTFSHVGAKAANQTQQSTKRSFSSFRRSRDALVMEP